MNTPLASASIIAAVLAFSTACTGPQHTPPAALPTPAEPATPTQDPQALAQPDADAANAADAAHAVTVPRDAQADAVLAHRIDAIGADQPQARTVERDGVDPADTQPARPIPPP
ncbi:hypothetical protein [Stenotrophomonas sp.]|uniref:hypothetical protein n=1 Tax=Stenotrophomonas sp. TaxID=69392 RepID=UPI002FC6A418